MTTADGAQRYFDSVPSEWDSLYSHENRVYYMANQYLRKGIFERYDLTFQTVGDLEGKKVLDIGTGTGRFAVECAKRGADVIGIDFAPKMIEFSRQAARRFGVEERCKFVVGDVLEHDFDEQFDVVLALGLFDYVREPSALMERIGRFEPKVFVASYPLFSPLYGLQRFVRYNIIRQCPIYYYDRADIEKLHALGNFDHSEIIPITKGHIGIGRND
ncbi:hypothetical protein PPSIR1_29770 [Plesiocystis pacifica SIR-1]|uniref:Methyltransferase domain-containing protein n=1 Tax=Plesiocystis pacifica SIR-1 TaxID=391625 RepID=A6GID5_9BACT|nr:class I SAM-dependent methyltransferase [Plesiocystis pacifica]EDM74388.1 hypothetical protein PPSIR1_29770 [Plesiocystis pacifica SIR-1]